MVDNILPGISGEVGKIGVHHGDCGIFLDDDGGGAGVFEQRAVEVLGMGVFCLDPQVALRALL